MNGFKTEKFKDWGRKSLKEKYSLKGIWGALGILLVIGLIGSFIFPFLPPRHGRSWTPPTTLHEYNNRVTTNLILFPVLIILMFILIVLRSTIDLGLGYKKLGDFEVTKIFELGHLKILILDNWRLFSIKKQDDHFETVKEGQRIQIKRTGTHRLINYYIYDKKAGT